MGNRLTQIATRTGDNGTTGLGDNTRVSKTACACTPWAMWTSSTPHRPAAVRRHAPGVRELLVEVQHQLFNLGGELSIPGFELLKPRRCWRWTRRWPPQRTAAAPAGVHPARRHPRRRAGPCVPHRGRRAERAVVALGAAEALKDTPRQYLNRLSAT
jgi:cob(I)alamin adenosyltransferase